MIFPPDMRNIADYYASRANHGHETEHCMELKEEIEHVIWNRLLKEFVDDCSFCKRERKRHHSGN